MSSFSNVTRGQLAEFLKGARGLHQLIKAFEDLFSLASGLIGDKGDITILPNGDYVINNNVVTNTKLAQVPSQTIKGRVAAGSGSPQDLTPTQVVGMLPNFTSSLRGIVPASGGITDTYLQSDGTWGVLPYDRLTPGNKGQITVTLLGVWNINSSTVTNANLVNMPGNTIKGNNTGISGAPSDLTPAEVVGILPDFTNTSRGIVPDPLGATGVFLGNSGWTTIPPNNITDGNKGQITVSSGGTVWNLNAASVTNSNLAVMPTMTVKGNNTGVSSVPLDLTIAQLTAMLPDFTPAARGLVLAPITSTGRFLKDDATWSVVPPDNITNGNKGQITVSGGGTVWTINSNSVTNSNLVTMAGQRIKGNNTGIVGAPSDLTGAQVVGILPDFTTTTRGVVAAPGTATGRFLSDSGMWSLVPANNITDANKGQITVSGGGIVWTINTNSVTNANLSTMPSQTIKGNSTGIAASPSDLTSTQVVGILPDFTTATRGVVPAPGTSSGKFLSDTGAWASLPAMTIPDGNKGQITVSSTGTVWNLNNNTVTNANMLNMPLQTIKANITASPGSPQDVSVSSVLDMVGSSVQGSVLYRGASTWQLLAPGLNGQVLCTGGTGANPAWQDKTWNFIGKTSTESRTNNTTLTNDSMLQVTLGVGSYVLEGCTIISVANNIMNYKYDLFFTGAATINYCIREHTPAGAAAANNNVNYVAQTTLIGSTNVAGSNAGIGMVRWSCSLDVTSAGLFSFRWAQQTANASAIASIKGGYIQYTKVV